MKEKKCLMHITHSSAYEVGRHIMVAHAMSSKP